MSKKRKNKNIKLLKSYRNKTKDSLIPKYNFLKLINKILENKEIADKFISMFGRKEYFPSHLLKIEHEELKKELNKEYIELMNLINNTIKNFFKKELSKYLPNYFTKNFIEQQHLNKIIKHLSLPENLKQFSNYSLKNYIFKHMPIYCPICQNFIFEHSDYLFINVTKYNYIDYWMLFLVTHYRHSHIQYYDKSWKYSQYRKKNKEYKNYEYFKNLVNYRAKRQIIRAIEKDVNLKSCFKLRLLKVYKKYQNDDIKNENIKILKLLYNKRKKIIKILNN